MVFSMMNLEKLEEKAQQVREELAQINTLYSDIISKSKFWSEKRDDLNKKVKNLIVEAKDYRKNRDEVNSFIKNLKSEIKSNNARITEISEKIKSIEEEIDRYLKKLDRKYSFRDLKKEIERLDWIVQTSSLPLEEEKKIVSEILVLEENLSYLNKIRNLESEVKRLKLEREALKKANILNREKISGLVEKSRDFHKKLLRLSEKISKLKEEADQTHRMFVDFISKAKTLKNERKKKAGELRDIECQIKALRMEAVKKREEKILSEARNRAMEKIKKGKKLSWDEFKILNESREV